MAGLDGPHTCGDRSCVILVCNTRAAGGDGAGSGEACQDCQWPTSFWAAAAACTGPKDSGFEDRTVRMEGV